MAALEAALVTPLFLVLLLGVFEFGLVFRDRLTIGGAVGDASRVGATQGPDLTVTGETADYSIISAIRQGTSAIPYQDIEAIVIYRVVDPGAADPVAQVPASCRSGTSSVADRCNSYDATTAFLAVQNGDKDHFACIGGGEPACGWDPTSRSDGPTLADIDNIGVYIRFRHDMRTGLFGQVITMEEASVGRIEAGGVE